LQPIRTQQEQQHRQRTRERRVLAVLIAEFSLAELVVLSPLLWSKQLAPLTLFTGQRQALIVLACFIPCVILFLIVLVCHSFLQTSTAGTFGTAHFATRKELQQQGVIMLPGKKNFVFLPLLGFMLALALCVSSVFSNGHIGDLSESAAWLIAIVVVLGVLALAWAYHHIPLLLIHFGSFLLKKLLKKLLEKFLTKAGTQHLANAKQQLEHVQQVVEEKIPALAPQPPQNSYGNAHFATPREIRPFAQQHASSLLLGTYQKKQVGLTQDQQEAHMLVVAPTKKGKTSSIIIPGLLQEQGHRSLFINDVKHELIDKCIGALSEKHTCYVLSPTRPAESNHYNPLAHVTTMNEAQDVAEAIIRNTGESQERFWDDATRLLLTATILHLRS
jgi:hypothetical protein